MVRGQHWKTSEHFFQASKFHSFEDIEAVRSADSPMEAADIGRDRCREIRKDWESIKDGVMLEALRAKFSQHQNLAEVLASTRGAKLVEATSNDRYWGDGGDSTGLNRLGSLLELVRSELPSWPLALALPPWVAHPDIARSDLFWRMGAGEDIENCYWTYRDALSGLALENFDAYFGTEAVWRP